MSTWMNPLFMVIAAGNSSKLFGDLMPYLGILLGIVVIGGIILYIIRRSIRNAQGDTGQDFTLQGLRNLHASGKLTDDEFQQARETMIGRLQTQNEQPRVDNDPNKAGNDKKSTKKRA